MIFLDQIKRSFLNNLMLGLGSEGLGGGSIDDKKDQAIQNNDTQLVEKDQKLFKEFKKLQDQIDGAKSGKEIVGNAGKYIEQRLTPEDYSEKEAEDTITLLNQYKERFKNLDRESATLMMELKKLKGEVSQLEDKYEFEQGVEVGSEGKHEDNDISPEELKTITNREFLRLPPEKRLQYITINHIDSDSVSSGVVKELEFTFMLDGKPDGKANENLYKKTTAGQTLPKEVRKVTSAGVEYERKGVDGEFFNKESHRRLIIRRKDTKVEITELASEKQLNEIKNNASQGSEKYEEGIDRRIAAVSLEKGIEPKIAILLFKNKLENDDSKEISLEIFLTDIARVQGKYQLDSSVENDIYKDSTALRILYNLGKDNYRKNAAEYGIRDIMDADKMSENIDSDSFKGFANISSELNVPQVLLQAIFMNESSGKGLGYVVPRFEKHVYERYINQGTDSAEAKMLATSYGGLQIMGFNYKKAGYDSVEQFVSAMTGANARAEQLSAFKNFIKNTPGLIEGMQETPPNYDTIATLYNGTHYKKFASNNNHRYNYAEKLQNYVQASA